MHSPTENIQDHINHFIKATKSLTGEELMQAKETFNKCMNAATQSLDSIGCTVSDRAKTTAKAGSEYAHDHPWQLIGIGAGLLMLGLGAKCMKKNSCHAC
jgi:hypothetical protein